MIIDYESNNKKLFNFNENKQNLEDIFTINDVTVIYLDAILSK